MAIAQLNKQADASVSSGQAINLSGSAPLLKELDFLRNSPLIEYADRHFGDHADICLALAIAVFLPCLRGALDHFVFKPIGRYMICGSKEPNMKQRALIYKWKESQWKSIIYLSLALTAFAASYQESWFTRSRAMWEGCTRLPCEFEVPPAVRLVYCLEMGHYLQAIPMLLFWEVRRKDFAESLAHHIATLVLIIYSYWLNVTRVGAMVFLLHDVNDVFMETAKMFRYAGHTLLPNMFFVAFVVSWVASRLVLFPNYVIRSTLFDTLDVAREQQVNVHPHYEILNGFLIFLLILHIYWTWLILKVLVRALTGTGPDDVREDDDDKDD